jgi:hypothetical protein
MARTLLLVGGGGGGFGVVAGVSEIPAGEQHKDGWSADE